jgi:hypothetical protein
MKTKLISIGRCFGVWIAVAALNISPARATVFTSDTTIAVDDTTFDGADIVVTNCTLTVDGPHAFNSLQVRKGGVLTHTQIAYGSFFFSGSVTGEVQVLSSTNAATLTDSNAVINSVVVHDQSGTITYTDGVDYSVLQPGNFVVLNLIPGSAIPDGSTVLVDYSTLRTVPTGINLAVTGNVFIESGGAIDVDAKGYSSGLGQGHGSPQGSPASGSGGGYGGCGGRGASNDFGGQSYGSVLQPTDKGSGGGAGLGGPGAVGGGAVNLAVGGLLQISGIISANAGDATNSRSGGGAGGSILLSAQTITGSGLVSVDGGAGEPIRGGGGGGGRIAIYAGTNLFSGTTLARGGSGFVIGGAGTFYTRDTNQPVGQVLVDNGGRSGTNSIFTSTEPVNLTVQGGAIVSPSAATGSGAQSLSSLLVSSNAWLSSLPSPSILYVVVSGPATIQAGGGILADGTGNSGGQGPGAGSTTNAGGALGFVGGGGGYGGAGGAGSVGNSGGATYGSLSSPVDRGSGGGGGNPLAANITGGNGGGIIQLTVTGPLVVNGKISAGGNSAVAPNAGGGSGGTVMLTAMDSLSGTGSILANGGAGNGFGGGGGGGRMAINYGTSNTFSGVVTAYGGSGASVGGAGTIVRRQLSGSLTDIVIVDNGGRTGAVSSLGAGASIAADLSVGGGASLSWFLTGALSIRNLLISSNATMIVTNNSSITIAVSGNASIQAGGWLKVDGDKGLTAGSGNGSSLSSPTYGLTGGGGGHGGYGSPSLGAAPGGVPFDIATQPAGRGGNGAPVDATGAQGGIGGGAIHLNVGGLFLVDGKFSADGRDGNSLYSGGGAGGSVWVTAGGLSGAGVITANGGRGNGVGGSGGGGRIALYFTSNYFVGTLAAHGGSNANIGGAGTIYTKASAQSVGLFTIDNGGGSNAAPTSVSAAGSDVTLSGGAVVVFSDSATSIRNLLVQPNSFVLVSNQNSSFTISSNVTILAGGGIVADGAGSPGGQGPGAGRPGSGQPEPGFPANAGSGAGHGGAGGNGSGSIGGTTYDSITEPLTAGSGGGSGSAGQTGANALGGSGGGVIHMNISRNLQVDGFLSANGAMGTNQNSGGGSGGAIWLTVFGGISGSGRISANGGAGNAGFGGGGAGGRIAIGSASNSFSGVLSASGASGFVRGGAGTIYLNSNAYLGNPSTTQLIVDNGGALGALTPLSSIAILDLIVRNGAIASLAIDRFTLHGISIGSNSFLLVTNLSSLTINSNVTIAAGGVMTADGNGFASGAGPGSGRLTGASGSGGGHGGSGGASLTGALGGSTYDTLQPVQTGSGGGGILPSGAGGSGGGLITMSITGNLNVDGILSANGLAPTNQTGGGGSGGGISLTASTFSGSGQISANGGAGGNAGGGGGGGGRIAVVYTNNTFTGSISAFGGSGFVFGGAGTIFLKTNSQAVGQLTYDNGGIPGASSSFAGSATADVTMKGGAIVSLSPFLSQPAVRNLLINSNAWLVATNLSNFNATTATIDFGGGIIADGTGSASGAGQGPGLSSGGVGGGGGHGGAGVKVGGNPNGGNTYDSVSGPEVVGSGGGAGSGTGTNILGGSGGGAMHLIVSGTLKVNGFVSANGTTGPGLNSGGGSGGTIWLTVGTLSGSGKISANGGAANGSGGGGGGGGRVAIYSISNTFSGIVSTFGGSGNGWAGAGTIYLNPTQGNTTPQLIVDNGGPSGVLSPLSVVSGVDLIIKGGAATASSSGSFGVHSLLIASNSWLSASNSTPQLTVSVFGQATIEAGGAINGDGLGQAGGQGAGGIFSTTGGGGGHGGFGSVSAVGASGGPAFDSILFPGLAGGRGGAGGGIPQVGGPGGGALHLTVGGLLQLDGEISLDGTTVLNANSGGGAGGGLLLTAGTLSGAGTISASGGEGNGLGGGGGGGRIALYYQSNNFAGTVIAHGAGGGSGAGGAGTIYTKSNDQSIGQLLVDNAGFSGAADTPVANIGVLDVTVAGGAVAYPASTFMVLSNLFVNTGALVTSDPAQTNLSLIILSNVVIGTGSSIGVDGQGIAQANGPGAGQASGGYGSGGGYGGMGGSSWTTFGGFPYGSATEPVDLGSGGGFGSGPIYAGGSQGGGAILLNIGGTLTVDGSMSANGFDALQDGAGGGSGGSIWVMARTVRGSGSISADGGSGEFFGGGGGGGGRIAIYYLTNPGHTNNFTGTMTAYGGDGQYWGDDGSVLFSAGVPMLRGISHAPVGIVSNAVSSIDVQFNTAMNIYSVGTNDLVFNTPAGPLLPGLFTMSTPSPYSLHVTFPSQTATGNYSFTVGPQITDLYGRPMSQVYTGAFSISLPLIQGTITGTNGQPVPGVLIQPSDATTAATTDVNGHYSLGFVPGSSFTLTPMLNGFMFAPGSRTYTNITNSIAGQDYLIVTTIGPEIAAGSDGANLLASWFGLPGVTYQMYYSTNLIDWVPYGSPIVGSNAPVQVPVPIGDDPATFLRIQANN